MLAHSGEFQISSTKVSKASSSTSGSSPPTAAASAGFASRGPQGAAGALRVEQWLLKQLRSAGGTAGGTAGGAGRKNFDKSHY